ncbi:hypothetical protein [Kitasatospora sp. NPDC088134]|uniref:hypothetical protein n=1 Tax=Kitasatospora sp. NPDC088134 TaxID=3364071 RepID=UPI00380FFE0A
MTEARTRDGKRVLAGEAAEKAAAKKAMVSQAERFVLGVAAPGQWSAREGTRPVPHGHVEVPERAVPGADRTESVERIEIRPGSWTSNIKRWRLR